MAAEETVVSGVPVVDSEIGDVPNAVLTGEKGVMSKTGTSMSLWRHCGLGVSPRFELGQIDAEMLAVKRLGLTLEKMDRSFVSACEAALNRSPAVSMRNRVTQNEQKIGRASC